MTGIITMLFWGWLITAALSVFGLVIWFLRGTTNLKRDVEKWRGKVKEWRNLQDEGEAILREAEELLAKLVNVNTECKEGGVKGLKKNSRPDFTAKGKLIFKKEEK